MPERVRLRPDDLIRHELLVTNRVYSPPRAYN
jgi:hypothetical protein